MNDVILPLELLAPGECGVVEAIHGEDQWVGRMAELGIRHGCRLEVLRPGSPCLLRVGNSRLCLRGDEGTRILVRPVA